MDLRLFITATWIIDKHYRDWKSTIHITNNLVCRNRCANLFKPFSELSDSIVICYQKAVKEIILYSRSVMRREKLFESSNIYFGSDFDRDDYITFKWYGISLSIVFIEYLVRILILILSWFFVLDRNILLNNEHGQQSEINNNLSINCLLVGG